MTWVRKDDQMPINRKVSVLSDPAYRLDDEALCWASRNLTDGRVPLDELPDISRRGIRRNADELVKRRRWHRAEDPPCPSEYCPTPGPNGWVIHDYLEYNPSREQVLKERAVKAERQKRWLDKKRGSRKDTSVDGSKDLPTDASRDASLGSSRDGPGDALETALETPAPYPAPPRPEGSGGGAPESTTARPAADGAADGGRSDQNLDVAHGPPLDAPNGPPVRPPDTSELRKTLAEARRRAHHGTGQPDDDSQVSGPSPLQRLREVTPDVPMLIEPEPAEQVGDG